ncbi:acetylcholine receptor subunit delta-like [Ruditapes philippinarum]|uniref:acetylcholine receptor subunit delta-like n=1 Tax=Ruditapes philippinarum TaxID=129788 RepID=UPI00295A82FE|nr:acetylcholine receptor subunit delta-like [Ruditapes philippinarum]
MDSGDKGIELEEYESNSEWDVINTSYSVNWESAESSVVFSIKIKRKPLYVLLSVIMPIIMLAVLNIFVFVLPCDSGEKASYSITVFLAFAVFLSIISATFPENSEVVALFSVYLIIQTLQSTVITLIALALTRYASFDGLGTPVPHQLKVFLNVITCKTCCAKYIRKNQVTDIEINAEKATKKSNGKLDNKHFILKKNEQNSDHQSRFNTWKEVVNKLDVIFFVFFTCVLIIPTLLFFVISATK